MYKENIYIKNELLSKKKKIKNLTLLQYRYNNKIEENYNFVFSTVKIEYFQCMYNFYFTKWTKNFKYTSAMPGDVTWPRPQQIEIKKCEG